MTEQTGQTGAGAPPEWYTKPPAWMTTPPTQQQPPPQHSSGSTGNNDLINAVNALPERVVNALRDAIQSAQQQSQTSQQQSGQGQENNQNDNSGGKEGVEQQQQPGPLSFGEKWFAR